jgi:hypothetical protein
MGPCTLRSDVEETWSIVQSWDIIWQAKQLEFEAGEAVISAISSVALSVVKNVSVGSEATPQTIAYITTLEYVMPSDCGRVRIVTNSYSAKVLIYWPRLSPIYYCHDWTGQRCSFFLANACHKYNGDGSNPEVIILARS